MLTPEQALLASLLAFRNGSALALPAGSAVTPIQSLGDGAAFTRAITDCNHEIIKAILTQTLATEEGEHQARAAAAVHSDVLDTLVRQGKKSVVRMLARDVLRPWVAYNWGPRADALVPIPSLGTTEEQDKTALMNAVANLQRAGYPHPSQYPAIDQMLGLPVRDLTQDAGAEQQPAPAGQSGTQPAESTPAGGTQGQPPPARRRAA
jgi:phage gp29-like protein